jgi:single-strand DNA-binding protein
LVSAFPHLNENHERKGGFKMLNSVVLAGNLGGDPEVFYNSGGQAVVNFNLAFRAGKEKTGWIRVAAFGKTAEITEKHIKKGDRIAVTGTLDHHQWQADDGTKHSSIQMIANSIEFIKIKASENGHGEGDAPF